jgi:excisionase family DNA binding protein
MPPSDVMTIEQLADYLQIAKSTLYKLAQEGRIPAQKVGKHWRFHRETIDRWIAGDGAPHLNEKQAPATCDRARAQGTLEL